MVHNYFHGIHMAPDVVPLQPKWIGKRPARNMPQSHQLKVSHPEQINGQKCQS
jgi:hypothetical protein